MEAQSPTAVQLLHLIHAANPNAVLFELKRGWELISSDGVYSLEHLMAPKHTGSMSEMVTLAYEKWLVPKKARRQRCR